MPEGPRRIVIHAGFHKTGTTSAQQVLRRNGPALWPRMALGLRHRLDSVCRAALRHSVYRDPLTLAEAAAGFDAYLAGLSLANRDLLISCEELSGHLPGRRNVADYTAAPELMAAYTEVLEQRFGDRPRITLIYTTRVAAPWLDSAYWQHVRASRMVLDHADFLDRFAAMADLGAIVDQVADRLPCVEVAQYRLEDLAPLRLGPATPLLQAMGLTSDEMQALEPVPRANAAGSDALLAQMLELNRSDLDEAALNAAKKALLKAERTG